MTDRLLDPAAPRACVRCGEALSPYARADARYCSSRCRVAAHRSAKAASSSTRDDVGDPIAPTPDPPAVAAVTDLPDPLDGPGVLEEDPPDAVSAIESHSAELGNREAAGRRTRTWIAPA